MAKSKRIKLVDIVPSKTYMIRGSTPGTFEPVHVVCDFTRGWLRGWVKMDCMDPVWHPNGWRNPYIRVKPVNPKLRETTIGVTRTPEGFECYTTLSGITLFEYEAGWAQKRAAEIRAMMHELQNKLEWLDLVVEDREQQLAVQYTIKHYSKFGMI